MIKHTVHIEKYYDPANKEDKANNSYFIFVGGFPYDFDDEENLFYCDRIPQKFNIDFYAMALKYNAFIDNNEIFFKRKKDAVNCSKELLSIINN
jgi:hypothetical protein